MPLYASMGSVAVILVNWNGWQDTIECMDTVLAQDHSKLHVFVVDNESSDGSIERITAWCRDPRAKAEWTRHCAVRHRSDDASGSAIDFRLLERSGEAGAPVAGCRVTLIRSGGNLGFAGGCNVGVRTAGTEAFDYFWFLNNDSVVASTALGELLRRASRDPRPGITGSTVAYYHAPNTLQAMGGAIMDVERGTARHIGAGQSTDDIPSDTGELEQIMDYVMGASMLVSRAYVREVGLMREDYFLYFEEIDWAIRGRGRFTFGYAPRSLVLHKAQASGSKAVRFSTRFFYRNRIRFASRFYPQHLAKTKRGMLLEMLRHAARGRWTHVDLIVATLRHAAAIAEEARASANQSD